MDINLPAKRNRGDENADGPRAGGDVTIGDQNDNSDRIGSSGPIDNSNDGDEHNVTNPEPDPVDAEPPADPPGPS